MVLMHRRGRVAQQKRAIRAIRAVQAHKVAIEETQRYDVFLLLSSSKANLPMSRCFAKDLNLFEQRMLDYCGASIQNAVDCSTDQVKTH
jgi:hypothetical protein